jgi:tetratricopeptide (TPR) repeat protein
MPGTLDFKYRAFLSYSHSDTSWAKWLHKRLEAFPMRGLAGRDTPLGPVPKTLRPIFRDREDFSAGHSLTEQTIANLDGSAALVVLCSPPSAQSHYVNEEIRLFKARHPERPVVPVIVDGKPGDPTGECFAPALRFEVDASGTVTDRPTGMLAADLREQGDGRELALAKVVAALIGVPSDEVYRRAERERKRQVRNRNAITAAILLLAIGGGYFMYSAQHRGGILIDTAAACTRYLPKDKAPAGPQDALGQCIAALQTLQKGAATDPRDAEILKLIEQGKKDEAEKLQVEAAEDDEAAGLARNKKAAERYRGIAATAGLADPKKARDYFAKAAKLDPDNIHGMARHADMERYAGNLAEAERAFSAVLAMGVKGRNDFELYWATVGLGDVRRARGDLAAALTAYRSGSTEAGRLAKANPGIAEWQYALGISHERVGDVQLAQGDLASALKSFQARIEITSRLAKADPGNTHWQRDLSAAFDKVGKVLVAQGDLAGALASYKNSLAIIERLTKADPANLGWQRDLSISQGNVGDVLKAQGDLAGALAPYKNSLAIFDRLAKDDPGNAQWQRSLSIAHNRLGYVFLAQGNLAGALASYKNNLAITERLSKADPGNLGWQRDLSVAYSNVGLVLAAQGDLTGALASQKDTLSIIRSLAKADPGNLEWQRDLSIAYIKVGEVLVDQGNLAGALASYKDSLAIAERLAKVDHGNLGWQHLLSVAYRKVGDVLTSQGDLAGALASCKESLTIAERLTKADPGNAEWHGNLSAAHGKVGDALLAQGDVAGARASFNEALAIVENLAKADPGNAGWQYELAMAYRKFADNGGNPMENWTKVVAILKALDAEGKLSPTDKKRLAEAEAKLAQIESAPTK